MLKYNNNNTINLFQRNYTITCRKCEKGKLHDNSHSTFFYSCCNPPSVPTKKVAGAGCNSPAGRRSERVDGVTVC